MIGTKWRSRAVLQLMLSLGARPWWVVNFRPGCFTPGKKSPVTYCTVIWVGRGVGLDGCGEEKNLLPPLGFEPRTFQPVSSLYTEYAVLILCVCVCCVCVCVCVCEDIMSKSRIQVCFVN